MDSKDRDSLDPQDRLKKRVTEWLHKSGLPLEIATLAAFRAEGFDAEHSTLYLDSESGKAREIDVVAWAMSREGGVYVQVNVECKSSPNPWVVVRDKENPSGYAHPGLLGVVSSAILGDRKALNKLLANPAFYSLSFGGHLLRQALAGENDSAYSAAMTVVKSARSVLEQTPALQESYVSVLPVIVVDSKLFECIVANDGSFDLVDVEVSNFTFTTMGPEPARTVIRIATRTGLPMLVKQCAEAADLIITRFEPRESE